MKQRNDFRHSLDWSYYLEKELSRLEMELEIACNKVLELQQQNDEFRTKLLPYELVQLVLFK